MAKWIPNVKFECAYLLKGEAATYLRVSASTFRRMEKAGQLPPPVKVGPRILYRRADLDNFIAPDSASNDNGASAAILAAVVWD